MKFVLRHKETNHEIYKMDGYYYERTRDGDFLRMKEVPEWIIEFDQQQIAISNSNSRRVLMETFIQYFKSHTSVIVNCLIAGICKEYEFFKYSEIHTGLIKVLEYKPFHIGTLNGCEIYMDTYMKISDNRIIDYHSKETLLTIDESLTENFF